MLILNGIPPGSVLQEGQGILPGLRTSKEIGSGCSWNLRKAASKNPVEVLRYE